MNSGIPDFRLDKKAMQEEIEALITGEISFLKVKEAKVVDGVFKITTIEGCDFSLDADKIIFAVGQKVAAEQLGVPRKEKRQNWYLKAGEKKKDKKFRVSELTLTVDEAVREARRCMKCGYSLVVNDTCIGCGNCANVCPTNAINLTAITKKEEYVYATN